MTQATYARDVIKRVRIDALEMLQTRLIVNQLSTTSLVTLPPCSILSTQPTIILRDPENGFQCKVYPPCVMLNWQFWAPEVPEPKTLFCSYKCGRANRSDQGRNHMGQQRSQGQGTITSFHWNHPSFCPAVVIYTAFNSTFLIERPQHGNSFQLHSIAKHFSLSLI